MWMPFVALVRKDLRLFFSNPRALLMTVAAPIAIGSFFGYIFGGGGDGDRQAGKVAILAVDQDNSTISREIVRLMTADRNLDVKIAPIEAAKTSVRKGQAVVAFVVPKDFGIAASRAMFGPEQKPEIELFYDPSHGMEQTMVQGMLAGNVMQAVSKELFTGKTGRDVMKEAMEGLDSSGLAAEDKAGLRDLLRSAEQWNARLDAQKGSGDAGPQGLRMPYEVRSEALTSGAGIRYNGYAHSFGGMGIQFILFVGIDVGITMLLQRTQGVWKRLRAAPLSRGAVLGSRAASAALTSMFVLMVLFGFARVVFGVRVHGSMAGFLGVCASFSLMTAAYGLLIAALGKTPEATRGLAIVGTLLMVMLGGAWVPTFVFPSWMQKLTVVVPTRWAMDGLDAMTWRGLDFSAAATPIALLTAASVVFGMLAVMRFKWEADG